ncbi:MAG: ATPase, T2SS/T4P/T4SS family, partial [Victivallales bacterium]
MLDSEGESLKGILLSEEICSETQLLEIEEEYHRTGKRFADLLIDFGIINEENLLQLTATSLGTDVVDLAGVEIPKEVIDMIDSQTIRMYGVVPLSFDGTVITVASRNPLNYQIADELRFILDKEIKVVVAKEKQIDGNIEKYYPVESETMHDMLASLEVDLEEGTAKNLDALKDEEIENMANDTPIIRFVDVVMYQAIKAKASDVHFEPFEKEFKIRYRVDGALYEMAPPPKNLAIPVISRG